MTSHIELNVCLWMQEGLIREAQSHLLVSCTRATKPVSGSWGVICSTEGGGGATEASPQDHKKHRETEEGGSVWAWTKIKNVNVKGKNRRE